MKQKEIKALLEEASQPYCSWQRRSQIQCMLVAALVAYRPMCGSAGIGRIEGFKLIIEKLYVDTLYYNPKCLPDLFPVFAMICGARGDDMLVADVDWSLVRSKPKDPSVFEEVENAKATLEAYQKLVRRRIGGKDGWEDSNGEGYGELEEVNTMLEAYERLGTPEEIQAALDAAFKMLTTIRDIIIAVKKSGVTAASDV